MTTYKTTTYETTEALHEAINSELSALAYPYTVKHKFYGEGQLISVKVPSNKACKSLYIDVAFGNIHNVKTIDLDILLARKLLTMPEILTDILVEAQTAFRADYEARERARIAAASLAYEQAKADAKKAEEEKKAEEAYQRAKTKALKEFADLAETPKPMSTADEFYYSLGWLAKHMGAFTAILPDYLGSSFEKHFGSEAPKTLVDGRAKTSGGYAKQWSWEFKCNIKKLKETVVPAYLQDKTTDFSKGIHNTRFLWDLAENYGFQFGKTQDIEKIRSHVPTSCLASFEAGLA